MTPEYLRTPIPPVRGHLFGKRHSNILNTINTRTDRFKNSFYPYSIALWNDIGPTLRGSESLTVFKSFITKIYRPVKKTLFNIFDNDGIKWTFQLRVRVKSTKKS